MKIRNILFTLLAFVVLISTSDAVAKMDKPAPDFTLNSVSGTMVSLSDYRGKTVVLEWTNHDCPYVQKHYDSDNMQSLQRKYTSQDVVWLSIISSAPGKQGYIDAETANQLTSSRNAAPTQVLFDPEGKVGRQYGARTTPHMFIIDQEGTLRYMGAIDSIKSANPADIAKATNYVDEGLASLLAGRAIAKKSSSPYGCSVKY